MRHRINVKHKHLLFFFFVWKITINDAKSADNPYLVYSLLFFLPKGSTMLTDGIFCWLESSDTVLKRYLFFLFF